MTLTPDDVRLLRVALLNYIPPPSDRSRPVIPDKPEREW